MANKLNWITGTRPLTQEQISGLYPHPRHFYHSDGTQLDLAKVLETCRGYISLISDLPGDVQLVEILLSWKRAEEIMISGEKSDYISMM
ncbi:MAG TPA: hypothetical protein EYO59_06390 [Chromatiaceae bacterium]|nr:hypothetical protein [Chromatiaceae bacterium]